MSIDTYIGTCTTQLARGESAIPSILTESLESILCLLFQKVLGLEMIYISTSSTISTPWKPVNYGRT